MGKDQSTDGRNASHNSDKKGVAVVEVSVVDDLGESSQARKLVANRRGNKTPVACLGVVYHSATASTAPLVGKILGFPNRGFVRAGPKALRKKNRGANVPGEAGRSRSRSRIEEEVSQVKMQFFCNKQQAEALAQREGRFRRGLGQQRRRFVQLVQFFHKVETKLFGGLRPKRNNREQQLLSYYSKATSKESGILSQKPQVSSLPLSVAFRLVRKYPSYYEIACDKREQRNAKRILKQQKRKGEKKGEAATSRSTTAAAAARERIMEDGAVPLFSIPGVRVVFKTEKGAVPYKVMFLSKAQMDQSWKMARKILSQSLLSNRRYQRRSVVALAVKTAVLITSGGQQGKAGQGGEGGNNNQGDDQGDNSDEYDSTAGLGDPPEIKEFLEELGEGGKGLSGSEVKQGGSGVLKTLAMAASSVACSTTALLGQAWCTAADVADQVLLDYSWGWKVLGLNPIANIEVSSLEDVLKEIRERDRSIAAMEDASKSSTDIVPYVEEVALSHLTGKLGTGNERMSAAPAPAPAEQGKAESNSDASVPQEALPVHPNALEVDRRNTKREVEKSEVGISAGSGSKIDKISGREEVVVEESEDEEIDLHGAIDCFLDWNQATKSSTSSQEEGEEKRGSGPAKMRDKETPTGFLIVGSVHYPPSHMIDFGQGDSLEELKNNFGKGFSSSEENEK